MDGGGYKQKQMANKYESLHSRKNKYLKMKQQFCG